MGLLKQARRIDRARRKQAIKLNQRSFELGVVFGVGGPVPTQPKNEPRRNAKSGESILGEVS